MRTEKKIVLVLGAALVVAGVLLHFPDFLIAYHARHTDGMQMRSAAVMMADMGMSTAMTAGMVLIAVGVGLVGWSLTTRTRDSAPSARSESRLQFRSIDEAGLTRRHWSLLVMLTIGLVIDTMKPASLGFVVPGMAAEYGLTTRDAAWLPFAAIAGTVVGSLVWGYLADIVGRRATLIFSSVLYIGTSICGFMPSFGWNLVMCFLMGASAGGMLPTVYSLTAESVPAKHRGPLIVLQSGLGATFGYLVASGAATLFIPLFGWRVLWLLGLPSGLLLLILCAWIPESPRFLIRNGQEAAAAEVMRRYGITVVTDAVVDSARQVAASVRVRSPFVDLFARPYLRRSMSVLLYGLGWGVVNWGFITFLPTFLQRLGHRDEAERLLFLASLAAVPSVLVAACLYGRWSSRGSMILYSVLTTGTLGCFTLLGLWDIRADGPVIVLVGLLLSTTAGMIAMLSPYSTELYPTALRATGSGLAAAASKVGGLAGPLLLGATPVLGTVALIAAAPLVVATAVLFVTGLETADRPLPEQRPDELPARNEANPTITR
ncbi:MFS transporter [Amycolatopsis sp. NPDC059027]|uniref:MFS transporter n=1 Tax=unclassified Amycolatopsis TaxID=2618356 RepID=UPI00366FCBC8